MTREDTVPPLRSGVRESINRHKGLVIVAIVVVAAASLGVSVFMQGREEHFEGPQTQTWYTTDDGATYFADAMTNPSPFMHDGKQAYRCTVFAGADGKRFVGYLVRDGARASASSTTRPEPVFGDVKPVGSGEKGWVSQTSAEGAAILQVHGSDGEPVQPVAP